MEVMDYLGQRQSGHYLESERNLRNHWEGTLTAGLAAVKPILRGSVIDEPVREESVLRETVMVRMALRKTAWRRSSHSSQRDEGLSK